MEMLPCPDGWDADTLLTMSKPNLVVGFAETAKGGDVSSIPYEKVGDQVFIRHFGVYSGPSPAWVLCEIQRLLDQLTDKDRMEVLKILKEA